LHLHVECGIAQWYR